MASAVNVGDKLVSFHPRTAPVRFSNLKHMAKSPAHYLHALTAGVTETRAMRVGLGAHARVLGGDVTVYEGERRGKDWQTFEALHLGERILTSSEDADARAIAAAVMADPVAMDLLGGHHEIEVQWALRGRTCVSHVDACSEGQRRVVELKVTSSAEPEGFAWHSARMLYHAQLAWYREALQAAQGWLARYLYIVAVEASPPHVVTCRQLTERALVEGWSLCHAWMTRLDECERANAWPGYAAGIVELDLPPARGAGALVVSGEDAA